MTLLEIALSAVLAMQSVAWLICEYNRFDVGGDEEL